MVELVAVSPCRWRHRASPTRGAGRLLGELGEVDGGARDAMVTDESGRRPTSELIAPRALHVEHQ